MGTRWLVCDTSGSMIESGKRLIVRSVVRQVEQFFRLGYGPECDLKLVLWSDTAVHNSWNPGEELPRELFDCKGSADGDALVSLVDGQVNDRFLILSDGSWSDDTRNTIKRWKSGLNQNALRIVKVGADANAKLMGPDVFDAEDFFGAMEGWSNQ